MLRTVAIVPAAGSGKRMGLKARKPFVLLGGKPLIVHTLKRLDSSKFIKSIVVAVEKSNISRFKGLIKRYGFKKVIKVVVGGKTRFESVRNCLREINHSFDIVLIHDAARPFVHEDEIRMSISLAKRYGGCIVAVPESDTVKLADNNSFIVKTLARDRIFRAKTPQVFRYDLIKKAYALKGRNMITDDSSLVERLGKRVKIFKGSYRNIKITTKEDLKIAEALL